MSPWVQLNCSHFLAISALGILQSHISSVQHQKSIAWQVRHRRSVLLLRISFYFGTFYAIGIDHFQIKHLFASFQPSSKSRFCSLLEQAPQSGSSLRRCLAPTNSFKPNLLRYTKAMAEKACHGFGSTNNVGLTQVFGGLISEERAL